MSNVKILKYFSDYNVMQKDPKFNFKLYKVNVTLKLRTDIPFECVFRSYNLEIFNGICEFFYLLEFIEITL